MSRKCFCDSKSFRKYKQTFNNSLTSEEVKSSSEDIFGRLANEKANGLEELRKIRLKQ